MTNDQKKSVMSLSLLTFYIDFGALIFSVYPNLVLIDYFFFLVGTYIAALDYS